MRSRRRRGKDTPTEAAGETVSGKPVRFPHAAGYIDSMTISLNTDAVEHARELIRAGKVDSNDLGDWSAEKPTAEGEDVFIANNGWDAYAKWHLGIDEEADPRTKKAYSFPYGDFVEVHRAGVIAAESRAGEYKHTEIEKAAKELLDLIDKDK